MCGGCAVVFTPISAKGLTSHIFVLLQYKCDVITTIAMLLCAVCIGILIVSLAEPIN